MLRARRTRTRFFTSQTHAGKIVVSLYRLGDGGRELVRSTRTNADGCTDAPLLSDDEWQPGRYELEFAVGAYFEKAGFHTTDPAFLDDVVRRVGLGEDAHYHVPLLVSPWSYSTYRGS